MIAVFAKSKGEYEDLEKWAEQYGDQCGMSVTGRWFQKLEDFAKIAKREQFPIYILSLDDIENQEVAVSARQLSERSQFIWIGEDERFGLSSYRVGVANFIMKPVRQQDINLSMKRCLERLEKPD